MKPIAYFKAVAIVVLGCGSTISFSQISGFYPQADTIFIGGGCTPAYLECSVNPGIPGTVNQDTIVVKPGWNTLMWTPNIPYPIHYEQGYFWVEDSLDQYQYELWFRPDSSAWWTQDSLIPFDAEFEFASNTAHIQLLVKLDGQVIDSLSQFFIAQIGLGVAADNNLRSIPTKLEVGPNYPNPFNPATQVRFGLPEAAPVTIEIFNVLGKRVYAEEHPRLPAGFHIFRWNGKNVSGADVSSGIYLFKLSDGKYNVVRKMSLLK